MPNMVLDRLWQLAREEGDTLRVEPELVFQPIGLILHYPLTTRDYTSTPLNSSTFAYTGGDGVHYGLLHTDGDVSDSSPVVMTVPMAFERPNLVVGASLFEFLCLGYQVGYAYLEHLTYSRHEATDWISHPQKWFDDSRYGPLSTVIHAGELAIRAGHAIIAADEAEADELEQQHTEAAKRAVSVLAVTARRIARY